MKNIDIDISKVILTTPRLILRAFEIKDLEDLYEYARVEGVGECAGWPHHENIETSQIILNNFINEKKTFAIVYKDNMKVIGSIGIEVSKFPDDFHKEATSREIGYALAKDYWHKGIMTEAVKAVIEYLFNEVSLDYITIAHFEENNRSRRVIEKCGFKFLFTNKYKTITGRVIEHNLNYYLKNPNKN